LGALSAAIQTPSLRGRGQTIAAEWPKHRGADCNLWIPASICHLYTSVWFELQPGIE
jgi:hypothetical protein